MFHDTLTKNIYSKIMYSIARDIFKSASFFEPANLIWIGLN